jgi:hypothetical protein
MEKKFFLNDAANISSDFHSHGSCLKASQEYKCEGENYWTMRANCIVDIKKGNLHYFSLIAMSEQKLLYIFFSGTRDVRDLFYDFDFRRISINIQEEENLKSCCVHSGFYGRYLLIKDDLERELLLLYESLDINSSWTILCTGHSLGGTLASFCSIFQPWKAFVRKPKGVKLLIFGTPLFACMHFNCYLKEKVGKENIVSIANLYDIVTSFILYPWWTSAYDDRIIGQLPWNYLFSSHFPKSYKESSKNIMF